MGGWADGRTGGWADGRTGGWVNRLLFVISYGEQEQQCGYSLKLVARL